MTDVFNSRVRLIYAFVFILALILAGKLFLVQMVHGTHFREEALSQYTSPVSEIFSRGSVYFEEKDGTRLNAATIKNGYTVAVNPSVILDPRLLFEELRTVLPAIDENTFLKQASKKGDPYEEIAHYLSEETAAQLQNKKIPGVSLHRERWRFYPHEVLASHVIGFVGFNDTEFGGRYGVERYYDDILKRNEEELYVNFFAEIFANAERSLFEENPREGDLVLSIEPEVERYIEVELETIHETWNAKSGGIIIMNPRDGSIYAMAMRPTFDPNHFEEIRNYTTFSNQLVENVFEMGSIIKPLTMAAGIDSGRITSEEMYYDNGFVEFDGFRIANFDGKARGRVSMQEVLNQSLNTGAVYVMRKTGKEIFKKYFLSFGFGEETGIDLPNEVPGLLQNLESPRDVEYVTASFGQGIAMTPIATVRALGALANEGMLVTPHVGRRIEYTVGPSKKISYGDEKRVLKKETAEEITRMLVRVVDEALLEGTVSIPRYSVAAKTGTAQIARDNKKGYYDDRFLHAFFGYFPAYDPKFLIFLYLEEPKEVRYASQTLTHPFINIVKFLIHYYEIPPDR